MSVKLALLWAEHVLFTLLFGYEFTLVALLSRFSFSLSKNSKHPS
jgi:hypothetical protein